MGVKRSQNLRKFILHPRKWRGRNNLVITTMKAPFSILRFLRKMLYNQIGMRRRQIMKKLPGGNAE